MGSRKDAPNSVTENDMIAYLVANNSCQLFGLILPDLMVFEWVIYCLLESKGDW